MNKEHPPYILVEDKKHLNSIAAELKGETELGVDVEADSLFHYQEKVCLIQISTPLQNILVDPLSLDDLSPLAPVFSDPNIRKVFHGADYDLRSLYRDFGIEVNALFDTQIAARFLGIAETGLAPLLREKQGIAVDKKYQKRDWSMRPLPSAMLAYAVHDTCHLLPLSRKLERELRDKDRHLWVEEECERLSQVRPVPANGHPLFLKFKGARKLDPRGLAVLESILKLRDDTARCRDRPPFKILGNEPIMEIAERKPVTEEDLADIKGLSAKQVRVLGPAILKKAEESLALPQNQLPVFPRKTEPRISAKVSRRIRALRSWREQRAKEMGMDPALVCTNAQIESLALAYPKSQEDLESIDALRAWQRRVLGKEICDLLKRSHEGRVRPQRGKRLRFQ
ncbi:MAG: HRDC domain-containing protein [Proteobacteria bacterium]|nr:HRDC domain-containing protein [Pseudomonadota bacterium]